MNTKLDLTIDEVEEAVGPLEGWAKNCHGASLALVRSGLLPKGSRVARGFATGVGIHSWVVVSTQYGVYDLSNWVVDITLWSYVREARRLYVGKASHWPHVPHGHGQLRLRGRDPVGPVLKLEGPVLPMVEAFLQMYAPAGLDYLGWMALMSGPMQGWPSKELVLAAYHTPVVKRTIPIDIVGMLTDENPGSLYW